MLSLVSSFPLSYDDTILQIMRCAREIEDIAGLIAASEIRENRTQQDSLIEVLENFQDSRTRLELQTEVAGHGQQYILEFAQNAESRLERSHPSPNPSADLP